MSRKKLHAGRLSDAGFTLIELLIVVLLSTVLLAALSMLLRSGLQASTGIQMRAATQEDARLALQVMTSEIGMASYDPALRGKRATNFWVNNTCGVCVDKTCRERRGLPETTANSIMVSMVAADPSWIGDDENEIIRYAYDVANQRITREVRCAGGAQSFLGDTIASGNPRETRVVNNALGIPVFQYFDARGNALPQDLNGAVAPAEVPNIRRVEITLAVQTDQVDPASGQRKNMIYSTSTILRNHAIQAL